MEALRERLMCSDHQLLRLLTPPFDRSPAEPGYIKAYPPGVRENGGQYNHGAVWAAWAWLALGDADQAFEIFNMVNPIRRTSDFAKASVYKAEPYVLAGDIYTEAPYQGQAGWTWYTGAAGWLFRFAVEGLLGFQLEGEVLRIDPCIPRKWPQFSIDFLWKSTPYRLNVQNPSRAGHGAGRLLLDGALQASNQIHLVNDRRAHEIRVQLSPESKDFATNRN
jgi:cyclic beta-1,2-glucan synthetase